MPDSDIGKARLDDGYFKLANSLIEALCKTNLSDRESRVLHTIMYKTYRWNKPLDWVTNSQIQEMTGIDISNIGKTKSVLIKRNILVKDGNKIGLNPHFSQWLGKSKPTQNKVETDSIGEGSKNKKSRNRLAKKSKPTRKRVETDPHIRI